LDPVYRTFHPQHETTGLAHPDAPAGGSGGGAARTPGPAGLAPQASSLPHIQSPAGRWFDWQGALPHWEFPSRVRAVYDAITGSVAHIPKALFEATGQELHEIVAGLLPGVAMMLGVLACTTALGAVVGAAVGALAFGAGAVPGAAAGAVGGFEAGIALLNWLGLAFLAAYIGKSLYDAVQLAGRGVTQAWHSVEHGPHQAAEIDQASKTLAEAVALVFRGILQGLVAFLLAKGTAAAAGRVPELLARLKASRLGEGFAAWVERNWAALLRNPKLQESQPIQQQTHEPAAAQRTVTPKQGSSGTGDGREAPDPSPATSKASISANAVAGGTTLPNAEKASIDPRKLTDYALNPDHPVGGNKARVFESALGYNKNNASELMAQIKEGVTTNPAIAGKVDQFGARYTVDIPVIGPAGSGIVRSGWIYKTGSDIPELTTLFVK
jgi:filamentous hemagglutinin